MSKVNKWVSSLAAGFISVAGLVGPAPAQAQAQAQAHAQASLSPRQANGILDSYHRVLSETLDEVARAESLPLRTLVPGDVCYTLFNAFNPTAKPNTPYELSGNFFVPAVLSVGGGITTADGGMYQMNGRDYFETPEEFMNAYRGWQTLDVIGVGCYDDWQTALSEGRWLNYGQAENFIQNGIDKLSAAIKYGQPGRAPQP